MTTASSNWIFKYSARMQNSALRELRGRVAIGNADFIYNNKYLRHQWFNLQLPLEATSTTRLTLRMCHGCIYTGSFVLDYHALYLQHFMSIHVHRIEIPCRAFPERVGPRILSLKSVDYFRTSDYFSGRRKRTILMCKTSRFTGKLDRGSVKKLEIK